jgi:hypothetical protein
VSGAASVPPDFDAAKYNAETGRDESFMWKLVFGMDLITSQPFAVTMPKPVEPKLVSAEALLTMTATGGATDASIASTPQELETRERTIMSRNAPGMISRSGKTPRSKGFWRADRSDCPDEGRL